MFFTQYKIILLSLLSLISATTHGMKRPNSKLSTYDNSRQIQTVNPKILELKNKYDALKKKLIQDSETWELKKNHAPYSHALIMCMYPKRTYMQMEFHHKKLGTLSVTPIDCTTEELKGMFIFKANTFRERGEYSAIGGTTMAQEVSHQEKIEFIQRLLAAGFQIKLGDRELAIIELWQRKNPIIQKLCSLHSLPSLLNVPVPDDVISFILRFIIKKELLF